MNEYTIMGTASCPYCTNAKSLLEKYDIEYEYIDLSADSQLRFQWKAKGYKTVPIIFVNKEVIGGFNELQKFMMKNEPRIRK
jgi:glutaredoxin 3